MAKELDLILEHERARQEISSLTKKIECSIYIGRHPSVFETYYDLRCKNPITDPGNVIAPCITAVWEYNKLDSEYQEEKEEPWLCESCRVTQDLINQRKAAKKRFGIAKMRISRFASDHLKSIGEK